MIDNTAQGCGECDFDRRGNLVLCWKCQKKAMKKLKEKTKK